MAPPPSPPVAQAAITHLYTGPLSHYNHVNHKNNHDNDDDDQDEDAADGCCSSEHASVSALLQKVLREISKHHLQVAARHDLSARPTLPEVDASIRERLGDGWRALPMRLEESGAPVYLSLRTGEATAER